MTQQIDVNQLLGQMSQMQAEISKLKQEAKARESSIYISRNNNLTLTWRKFGVQRSFLIPSKRQDGTTWLRGGGIPATYSLNGGKLIIQSVLDVDADEAKTFQEKFIMQSIVQPVSATRGPAQQTPTESVTPTYSTSSIAPIPVTPQQIHTQTPSQTPSTDMDALVQEAQGLVDANLYKDLGSAVNAVKKAKGIK